ncbi:MAG: FtsQ-type POTRA domain-containing protein [Pseudomonadota bacterium]
MNSFLTRQTIVRRRNRWKGIFKFSQKFLLGILVVSFVLSALFVAYMGIVRGSYFTVNRVDIEGEMKIVDKGAVERVAAIPDGISLFSLNVDDVQKRLLEHPWIKAATVRRRLPNTVWIYVEEHKPVAILSNNSLSYVDEDGEVFKGVDAGEPRNMAIISGIEDKERLMKSIKLINYFNNTQIGKKFSVSELAFDPLKGYIVITDKNSISLLIGSEFPEQRISQIDKIYPAIEKSIENLKYIISVDQERVVAGFWSI